MPAHAVDLRFRATAILEHPVSHDAGVTFLSATSETEARLRLLDCEKVDAGGEAWAQAVLLDPVALRRGDRCVLRSPNETIGGGVIVAVNPSRHRRNHVPTLKALALQLAGSPAERLLDALAASPVPAAEAGARLGIDSRQADEVVRQLRQDDTIVASGVMLYSRAWLDAAAAKVLHAAEEFLAANRLRSAAPREHVRSVAGIPAAAFEAVVQRAEELSLIESRAGGLAPAGHEIQLSAGDRAATERFLASIRGVGFSPPTDSPLPPPLLAYLSERGDVEDTGAGVVYPRETFDRMLAMVRERGADGTTLTLADVRDMFGTSRKYAQAFLEHLDALHITRRMGDTRIVISAGDAP